MHIPVGVLIISSLIEIILLGTVIYIFYRLRKSEDLLFSLRQSQKSLVDKLTFSEQMEKELIKSFEDRQRELLSLDVKLEKKIKELKHLLKQLEEYSNSPKILKEIIIKGHKQGESVESLSLRTGLSIEEIEWILEQE